MNNRRKFIKDAALTAILAGSFPLAGKADYKQPTEQRKTPLVISTWNHGLAANEAAWKIIKSGGTSLDAAEHGVKVTEADPSNGSVGIGGRPDRDGRVTLDACIMNEKGDCGSVACLEHIIHPISVARLVMEKTPHVMLVGEGALMFALSQGFQKQNLLTPESEAEWKAWLQKSNYQPVINIENHDTIGLLAIDEKGDISGACTTSGLAYKMHGRVGDSPIIGAGLYVDNEVGGATATGLGEAVIRQCGSFLVVELMRNGLTPLQACKTAVDRIIKHEKNLNDLQVGFIAVNKLGQTGGYAIHPGFNYALCDSDGNRMIDADFGTR